MKKLAVLPLVGACLLSACQAVNTTNPGAVGISRPQYMSSMVSSAELNAEYAKSYHATLSRAAEEGKLDKTSATAKRVQTIARRIIPQTRVFRPDASGWPWEINVIKSNELNANCGPGGKIIFYSGLVDKLHLSDNEIAAVLGHEIAHALREHSREQLSKAYGVNLASQLASAFGLGGGVELANVGVKYLMELPNTRTDESEADLIGLELAARAGYNPNGAVSLWQKMGQVGGAPPEFMSTHPSAANREAALRAAIPRVMPLYEAARRR